MGLNLRRAKDADRTGIWSVHVRAIQETCSKAYSAEQIASWVSLLSPDSYTTVIRERVLFVADDGDRIVGFGQLNPDSGEVEAVYVLPEQQGKGIGRLLLGCLEDEALERSVTTLRLSATPNAVSFYERAGYVRGEETLHRLPSGSELICIRMAKNLA